MSKKFTVACLATLALFAVCGASLRTAKSHAQAQSLTRIGIRNHVYKAPLEVVGVKVNGQSVTAGERFQASQDWIKQLTITVKNTSDRDLIGVGASVEFPYDDKDQPTLPEIEFQLGLQPMIAPNSATDFLLRPGEAKELHLPAGWFDAVDAVIKMASDLTRPNLNRSRQHWYTRSATPE